MILLKWNKISYSSTSSVHGSRFNIIYILSLEGESWRNSWTQIQVLYQLLIRTNTNESISRQYVTLKFFLIFVKLFVFGFSFTDFYKEQKNREKAQRFKEERIKHVEDKENTELLPMLDDDSKPPYPTIVKVWSCLELFFFTC